jgi:hypothetical protein
MYPELRSNSSYGSCEAMIPNQPLTLMALRNNRAIFNPAIREFLFMLDDSRVHILLHFEFCICIRILHTQPAGRETETPNVMSWQAVICVKQLSW